MRPAPKPWIAARRTQIDRSLLEQPRSCAALRREARRVRCAPWGSCGVPASASPWASPTITAVAPIRPARLGHALEVVVDRLDHSGLEQFDERMSGASAIIRAPFHASACIGFIIQRRPVGSLIVAVRGMGVLHHADLINSAGEYPLRP